MSHFYQPDDDTWEGRMDSYIEESEKQITALRAEVERLDGTVAHWVGEVRNLDLALVSMTKAHDVVAADRDRLAGEVDEIAAALPGVAFMDPPDGGSVSIAEQVRRMYAALQSQDAEVARLTAELAAARELLSIHSGQWVEDALLSGRGEGGNDG